MKLHHTGDYRVKREGEYPPIGDQIDALWKALEPNKTKLPKEARDMMERVQAVKRKFPKVEK
jgi:hypothetical protein